MRAQRPLVPILGLTLMWLLLSGANNCLPAGGWQNPHEPVGQLTFTSPQADPITLSPDGTRLLIKANRTPYGQRVARYFWVDPFNGGLEEPLQIPEGGPASLSPDGKQLAYNIISRECRFAWDVRCTPMISNIRKPRNVRPSL